ncbi:dsRBD fold-containing protein [Prauserella oleivorans]|uniref:DsRBD fold-containing protein n=1 Tax=Prauserella oleivorans TaxID=1478153 RepID=A0ABW5WDG5_9PSEU
MAQQARWTISVVLDEHDGTTQARIRLGDDAGNHFIGIGLAHRGVDVARVPQVAGELAIARALTDLTEELLTAVAADIESAHDHASAPGIPEQFVH